jgi:hypothetical protein
LADFNCRWSKPTTVIYLQCDDTQAHAVLSTWPRPTPASPILPTEAPPVQDPRVPLAKFPPNPPKQALPVETPALKNEEGAPQTTGGAVTHPHREKTRRSQKKKPPSTQPAEAQPRRKAPRRSTGGADPSTRRSSVGSLPRSSNDSVTVITRARALQMSLKLVSQHHLGSDQRWSS